MTTETTPKTAEANNLAAGVGHASFREYTPIEKACYIHDKGWKLAEHRQDGNHQYTINGGRNVHLQTAWEIQIAVEKGDLHGFGTE